MYTRSIRLALAALVLVLALATLTSPAFSQSRDDIPSLYQRMGGYDVIARFVDDFFGRMGADPGLSPMLGGLNTPAQIRVRQNFIDFICSRIDGPCLYQGRDMRASHAGLPITGALFTAVIAHMRAALEAQAVPADVRQELLTMLEALRPEIVQQ